MIILNYPNYRTTFFRWRPLEDIPNLAHFKFVGLHKEGHQIICEVIKNENGTFTLKNNAFKYIKAWRAISGEDEKLLKS